MLRLGQRPLQPLRMVKEFSLHHTDTSFFLNCINMEKSRPNVRFYSLLLIQQVTVYLLKLEYSASLITAKGPVSSRINNVNQSRTELAKKTSDELSAVIVSHCT
jgi:hypothetical protein